MEGQEAVGVGETLGVGVGVTVGEGEGEGVGVGEEPGRLMVASEAEASELVARFSVV